MTRYVRLMSLLYLHWARVERCSLPSSRWEGKYLPSDTKDRDHTIWCTLSLSLSKWWKQQENVWLYEYTRCLHLMNLDPLLGLIHPSPNMRRNGCETFQGHLSLHTWWAKRSVLCIWSQKDWQDQERKETCAFTLAVELGVLFLKCNIRQSLCTTLIRPSGMI